MKDKKNTYKNSRSPSEEPTKAGLIEKMSFDEIMRRGIRVPPPKDKD